LPVVGTSTSTRAGRPREARIARFFASPASVLVIVPALVVAVGVGVLLMGRRTTRDSVETMARHQLVAQATSVRQDVEKALAGANPVLDGMRSIAESNVPEQEAIARLREVAAGREGVANTAVVFPNGLFYGTLFDETNGDLIAHVSRAAGGVTERTNYGFRDGQAFELSTETSDYDAREKPRYKHALEHPGRTWMSPRTFSSSHKTGVTIAEAVYSDGGQLIAVLTIDFEVAALSKSVALPPLSGARTVIFARDGTVLAFPAVAIPDVAKRESRLLRYEDFHEPSLDALFGAVAALPAVLPPEPQFLHLTATDGAYFASVAQVGDWCLGTLVPEATLFAATWKLDRQTLLATAMALVIAFCVALMFAWNLLRMRRIVGEARAEARSAEERAKELGSYRLVAPLGAGGMGEVWRAEHQLLARQAAIKLVRTETLTDERDVAIVHERFRREAQTLASLRSRHTIELYDYGVTSDGAFFLVMELLDGLDLAQLVRAHGPQPAARVIGMMAQACQSLAEAHDARLFHRDIKPANLFLCRAADEVDIVKLLDFGIVHNMNEPILPRTSGSVDPGPGGTGATTGERLTVEGAVIGTPGFVPPETVAGIPFDGRGDLYSLGCVAWVLLTGGEVFHDPDDDALTMKHVAEPVPKLSTRVIGWLPAELERLVTACLAKQPADRPPDARALANALFAIEIPDEHAWTREMAADWWKVNRPAKVDDMPEPWPGGGVAAPDDPTALAGKRLVPHRDDRTTVGHAPAPPAPAAPAAPAVPVARHDARTIAARPGTRPGP
jgi:serine/threonine protein kinase